MRKRRRRGVLGGMTALVTALAVALGGWLLWSDDAPAAGKRQPAVVRQAPDEVRETVEKPPVSPEGNMVTGMTEDDKGDKTLYAPGTWVTDKVFAKGVADRMYAYELQPDYDKAWNLQLGGHICATSEHVTVDGRTAVVIQPPKSKGSTQSGVCDQVVFVDLNTGKKLWQKKMPAADFAYATNTNITLTKGVVAIAWGRGSVAYDMKDGKQLWNGTTTSKCEDQGFAGGRALLALVKCGESSDPTYRVQKLDPRSGKALWTYKVASGVQEVYLPSSDPPVLAVAAGDMFVTDLISLDNQGKYRTTISLEGYEANCGTAYFSGSLFGVVEKCESLAVGGGRAYVMSKEHFDLDQPTNWIVAFDLKTGKTQGKFEGRDGYPVSPVRTSGDELLLYREGGMYVPSALVSWNPVTDKETPYLLFVIPDDELSNLADPEQADILVEQGRVFFSRRQVEEDADSPDDPVTVGIAYGSMGLKH